MCWFSENPINEEKVRDHDPLTGKCRKAACNKCNIECKQNSSSFVSIFFHNFSGYDYHLIFEELLTQAHNQKYEITKIPEIFEKQCICTCWMFKIFIFLQICLKFNSTTS